jgi:hypothetical protein
MKTSDLHKEAFDSLESHKKRLIELTTESWLPGKKKEEEEPKAKIIDINQAAKLTGKTRTYYMQIIQNLLNVLRTVWKIKYLEDFGEPRSAKYTFSYDSELNELHLHVSLKIRGRSNTFLYQGRCLFYLTTSNAIRTATTDPFLYLIALFGSQAEIHSKDQWDKIMKGEASESEMTKQSIEKDPILNSLEDTTGTIRL